MVPEAVAACREATVSTLPMPTWTWLRSWRANLSAPTRLAADAEGMVLATDPVRGQVVARHADGSLALVKRDLGHPTSIALDALGGVLVGDGRAGRVTVYDSDWNARYSLGAGDGEFGQPGDIAVDPQTGEIYVSDTVRHVVAVYSGAGVRQRLIGAPAPTDGLPAADGLFRTPTGVTIAGNELLVADQLNFRVQVFDKTSGAFLYCLGNYRASSFVSPASGPSRTFGMPQGLWVDTLGRLYVADAYQGEVRVVDRSNGALIGSLGTLGDEPGALRVPSDLVIDRSGRLFVASTNNARLDLYGLDGYSDPERFTPAFVTMAPDRIDRTALPLTVNFTLEVPGYRLIDIVPASLRVNGLLATLAIPAAEAMDTDDDGVPELRLSVSASALLETLAPGASAPVTVTGDLGWLAFTAVAWISVVEPTVDADNDGVLDELDVCPGSTAGEPVNHVGCAIAQTCPCAAPQAGGAWRNHGAYVQCVTAATGVLRANGGLNEQDAGARVNEAASSACGRSR